MCIFHSAVTPPSQSSRSYWFIFRRFSLLVQEIDEGACVPPAVSPDDLGLTVLRSQYLGTLNCDGESIECYSAEVAGEVEPPSGMEFLTLRRLFGRLDDSMLALAGRAVQIVDWDRTHQFCGRCGRPVEQIPYERAKQCPGCGLTTYPRIAPAVIVSVERRSESGPRLLLARNRRHPAGFFSVLAGFVEPGESLEECVRREIREEVGLEVQNITYFGSQSWPFPNSLMIAFTTEYGGGKLELEEEEIAEAGWFGPDQIPPVPPPVSIARQLIDDFVRRNTADG